VGQKISPKGWPIHDHLLIVVQSHFFNLRSLVSFRHNHDHRAFDVFRPGINLTQERALRRGAGQIDGFRAIELYPDVLPCLKGLQAAGYRIGVAGNHFADLVEELRPGKYAVDYVGSSQEWGVEKPSPEFFARIVHLSGVSAGEIAYVGDRLDNDVLPAKAAGMVSVFLSRGPWGLIHARRPAASEADIRIESLAQLQGALGSW
jgi:HAD superfamily hydrolase (TIGR01549 family)